MKMGKLSLTTNSTVTPQHISSKKVDVYIDASTSSAFFDETTWNPEGQHRRTTIKEKLKSIPVFIISSIVLMSMPLLLVSGIWTTLHLFRVGELINTIRVDNFERVYSGVSHIFDLATTMEHTLAGSLYENGKMANNTFEQTKMSLEHFYSVGEQFLEAGGQLQYNTNDKVVGLKKVLNFVTHEQELVLYVNWNTEKGTEGLPDAALAKENIVEYLYTDPNTISEQPYHYQKNNPTDDKIIEELNMKSTNDHGFKAHFQKPRLSQCYKETDDCNYTIHFSVTLGDVPIENGVYTTSIQVPFIPLILQESTTGDSISMVIYPKEDIVLATSDKNIEKPYHWDEVSKQYEIHHGATFSQNQEIQHVILAMQERYGRYYEKLQNLDSATNLQFLAHGTGTRQYQVDIRTQHYPDLDLIVVMMTDENSYLKTPIIISSTMIGFSAIMVLLLFSGGCCFFIGIYRPIKKLMVNMEEVINGLDLESVDLSHKPYFTEFSKLHYTFSYLVEKLKLYRTFLPEHILKQVEKTLSEDGNGEIHLKNQKEDACSEVDSNDVDSENSSLGTTRTSIMSELILQEGQGALTLKKMNSSYVVIRIQYNNSFLVGSNMNSFSKILRVVLDVSENKDGRVESFSDSEIVIGVNTIGSYKYHEKGACQIALRFYQSFSDLGFVHSNILKIGIGITTGQNFLGTIGTIEKRSWQSVGSSIEQARLLAIHSMALKVPILIERDIVSSISENIFQYRFADFLHLPSKKLECFHLVSSHNTERDKWIYDIEDKDGFAWGNDYTHAIDALFMDDIEEAMKSINLFCQRCPKDQLGRQFKNLIEYIYENHLNWKDYEQACLSQPTPIGGYLYKSIIGHKDFSNESSNI